MLHVVKSPRLTSDFQDIMCIRKSISIQPTFATPHGSYTEFSWHKSNNIKQANVHFQKPLQNKENNVCIIACF